jgi:putative transposase
MTNLRRLRLTDRIFFVTANVRPAQHNLTESEFELILDVFKETRERLHYSLCGYVLMPDHWHALIWPTFPITISRVLKEIKGISSHRLNQARHKQGDFWQPRFWDRFVRNKREFNQRLEYMHMNPVRKGLVHLPDQWRWSSFNNFAMDKGIVEACPIQIDYIHLSDDYRG